MDDKRPKLKVFNSLAVEALRPGYAYLIRSSVRMPELYPLLGELIFGSSVEVPKVESSTPNIVGMFIEDTPDNLVTHLGRPHRFADTLDPILTFKEDELKRPCMAAWLDTFGDWKRAREELEEIGKEPDSAWWRKRIAGAGNPMAVMRFFRQVQKKTAAAPLNVFLLNSLSNLYRNLGLSESAAFLKTLLGKSIWSGGSNDDNDAKTIGQKQGIFFAVLQEDVLKSNEASYLESFFDGVIRVSPCWRDGFRLSHVHVQVLPEILKLVDDFIYMPSWQYENDKNIEHDDGWRKGENSFIAVRVSDNKVSVLPENPYFNISGEQARWLSVPR